MQINSISYESEGNNLILEIEGLPTWIASVIQSPIGMKATPEARDVFNEPGLLRNADHILFDNEREIWLISRGGDVSEERPEHVRATAPSDWPDRFRAVISTAVETAISPKKAEKKAKKAEKKSQKNGGI